ncbi:MAG: uracil-DNA glycosylase [Archangium sp.]|nr:uracil-DNA glycosylase [Archangium sp.]
MTGLKSLHDKIIKCRKCDRLVEWREEVAEVKRRAYRDETYWGRPVTGFGDPKAKLVIVGLAPGAHGANRTGRIFTGDRSGDFLYAALHRQGFANQPTSRSRDDGLKLTGAFITCPVRCVPPQNQPTPDEVRACRPFLAAELKLLQPRVFLALGHLAWKACLDFLEWPKPLPAFSHGARVKQAETGLYLLGSFHVSQQNTQTGRLTEAMFDRVLEGARSLLDLPAHRGG